MAFSYDIPIIRIKKPGTYAFSSVVFAQCGLFKGISQCEATLPVVKFDIKNSVEIINCDEVSITPVIMNLEHSPATRTTLEMKLLIPNNIRIQFTGFGIYNACSLDGSEIGIGDVLSNTTVFLSAESFIPQNATVQSKIYFKINSLSNFSKPNIIIKSIIERIFLNFKENQMFLNYRTPPLVKNISIKSVLLGDGNHC